MLFKKETGLAVICRVIIHSLEVSCKVKIAPDKAGCVWGGVGGGGGGGCHNNQQNIVFISPQKQMLWVLI